MRRHIKRFVFLFLTMASLVTVVVLLVYGLSETLKIGMILSCVIGGVVLAFIGLAIWSFIDWLMVEEEEEEFDEGGGDEDEDIPYRADRKTEDERRWH